MKTALILIVSHLVVLCLGFALGIYALPILTAPAAPTTAEASLAARETAYTGQFRRPSARDRCP
jgi:hypothetical protein